jgi:hypothetical protein
VTQNPPTPVYESWSDLIDAMNAVAGCCLLYYRVNPDLQHLIDRMRDAEFALQTDLETAGLL